jgi:hypothetical protein
MYRDGFSCIGRYDWLETMCWVESDTRLLFVRGRVKREVMYHGIFCWVSVEMVSHNACLYTVYKGLNVVDRA